MTIHSGERAMWAAVLIQALRDIAGTSGDSEYHKSPALHRDRALLWSLTPDFTETCHCAGVEPSRVKAAIARLSAKDIRASYVTQIEGESNGAIGSYGE
ncbi:hypothetical protein CN97_00840 [Haematobacter massiliensis]|uniref:Uncharacterized protein n=1 Tax=Haematobacter massiliensis TaxID=195105 RepID=A0A086Y0J1_9RHOB|nr:hypothetical protein [Haematobacter massiliensis]KFI27791.1 hypothetical protein CN97_00840 [Haematobacter massiliensis]OWJ82728.1 hypothetical protein CDV51_17115 [Haematobacter massiliensis]